MEPIMVTLPVERLKALAADLRAILRRDQTLKPTSYDQTANAHAAESLWWLEAHLGQQDTRGDTKLPDAGCCQADPIPFAVNTMVAVKRREDCRDGWLGTVVSVGHRDERRVLFSPFVGAEQYGWYRCIDLILYKAPGPHPVGPNDTTTPDADCHQSDPACPRSSGCVAGAGHTKLCDCEKVPDCEAVAPSATPLPFLIGRTNRPERVAAFEQKLKAARELGCIVVGEGDDVDVVYPPAGEGSR